MSLLESCKLQFKNFIPSTEDKNILSNTFAWIQETAPSDAIFTSELEKTKNLFQGSIRIVANAGTFIAHASAKSPVDLMRKLKHKIGSQMKTWKAHRFEDVQTG